VYKNDRDRREREKREREERERRERKKIEGEREERERRPSSMLKWGARRVCAVPAPTTTDTRDERDTARKLKRRKRRKRAYLSERCVERLWRFESFDLPLLTQLHLHPLRVHHPRLLPISSIRIKNSVSIAVQLHTK